MAFLNSLNITGSALTAQRFKTDVILQNIANQNNVASTAEDAYKRQQVVFEERGLSFDDTLNQVSGGGVRVTEVVRSDEEPTPVYDPDNPLADEDGYVYKANVDNAEEQVDLLEATRIYESNMSALSIAKAMAAKGLEIGKSN
ncbi:MAG: flagellar basal body rod protein FlgC [Oscillospiraceae bacterium]